MKEIWKDIKGYEGLYQVSNLGRVKSLKRNCKGGHGSNRIVNKRILAQCNTGRDRDYKGVRLCKNKILKSFQIHRLVAEAFIPNSNNYPCVNHKKEFEKWNNKVSNLEWCTYKYNINYGTHNERAAKNRNYEEKVKNTNYISAGIKSGLARCKKVYQYDKNLNLIKEWNSTKQCKEGKFNQSCISECCLGKRKTHKGYIWSYERID